MTNLRCVLDAGAALGEGPCWDAGRHCLWWVDIHGHAIHRFDPATGEDVARPTPGPPGSLILCADGRLIVAMGDAFVRFDPDTGSFDRLATPQGWHPQTRMNDGRTDRQGRFWAGSIHEVPGSPHLPVGALYRFDASLAPARMVEGVAISNGLAWSPDGRTMYHTDSGGPIIWAWDFDPATGDIAGRRQFVDLSDLDAVGDGATVDVEGGYWTALPFRGLVNRYDPDGRLVTSIAMPVDCPTCCEFGGADLATLYVTSATFGRAPDKLPPGSGGLFAFDPGVRGIAHTPFAG